MSIRRHWLGKVCLFNAATEQNVVSPDEVTWEDAFSIMSRAKQIVNYYKGYAFDYKYKETVYTQEYELLYVHSCI